MQDSPVPEVSKLDSGITIVTEQMPSVRSVAFGFWFETGAANETPEISGISHFIEHLIFKGTRKIRAKEISEKFDSLGAELNAFTGKEYTCYYSRLISDHLEEGFQLLSHMLKEPAFRKRDIDSERKVVLEEIAMYEDSPDDQIHDIFTSTIFSGNTLGNVVLGNAKAIREMSREDIVNYYTNFYHSGNLMIAAAGRVNHLEILELAHKYLNGCKRTPSQSTPHQKKRVKREKLKIVKKDTQQAHFCIGFPIFGSGHPDRFAMAVLDDILGGSMSSRLFTEIREKRGLAYSVFSYHTFFKSKGYIAAYIGTNPSRATDAAKLALDEFRKLAEEEVSEEELKKSKEHLKGHLALSSENTNARMMRLGRTILGKEEVLTIDEIISRIDSITPDDIKRLAKTYFLTEPTLAVIGPVSEKSFLPKIFRDI